MVDSKYNILSQWKHSIIVSIPKKGSSHSLDNQRGIAKSCAISMIRNKILLSIKSVAESTCSTKEQIMTLRFHLDAARTHRCSLTVVLVDYSKAFDSVDRRAIQVVVVVVSTPSRAWARTGSQTPARGPPSFPPHTSNSAATPTGSVHKSQTVSVVGLSG